tara:strand:- start:59 stop:538 length:480 start_codon:yes stop_codon:yes gene_type:complete
VRRKSLTPNQFLDYVTKPLSADEVDTWIMIHGITLEKSNLFFDFICSLYILIEDTHLGDEVIVTEEQKLGHFKWCWEKNIDNFKVENIFFKKTGDHWEYFWNFFSESFYKEGDKENIEKMDDYMKKLFELHVEKTKSDLDVLTDIYKILDKSLIIDTKK